MFSDDGAAIGHPANLKVRMMRLSGLQFSAWIVTAFSMAILLFLPIKAIASDEDLAARLSKDEQIALGHTNASLPMRKRLDALEKAVYGHTHDGSDSERMDALEKNLGLSNSSDSGSQSFSSDSQQTDHSSNNETSSSNHDGRPVVQIGVSRSTTLDQPSHKLTEIASAQPTSTLQPALPPIRDVMNQASQAMSSRDFAEASRLYASVAERDPYNDAAFFQLGQVAASKGDIVNALMYFRIAFNLQPQNTEYKGAVNYFEQQIKMHISTEYHICNYYRWQGDLSSLLNQGVRFWGINAIDQSKLLFQRVVSLDPNNIDGWFDLGVTEERQGNLKEALADYHRALSLYQTPGSEQLLGPPPPQHASMFQLFANSLKPRRMLSSTVDSGEDRQFNAGSQLYAAIAQVSEKLANPQAVVQQVGWPVAGVKQPQYYYQYQGSYIDTCDRCRIVRSQKMNPS
jgi:tetratricopeptide (TPR) repeat protein